VCSGNVDRIDRVNKMGEFEYHLFLEHSQKYRDLIKPKESKDNW